ncbi:DDB1- and CUL4-associated factor 6 [Sorghum bicolor]|uniref:Anaphase-promoting complex subunit 4 WD40 domain-containing protein n=1 Tax=Sorghum bicolor TaxID=4558 RepID=A0A1W0VV36_SORBI|nr:DDB1- and CUL4-associated factor 6 [Sorghum bicolor]OQU77124.1 hypothetical protein SORBI_3010G269500 [Sorghum bicolor]|eukprot:XP_002439042.1 DDB1- and CUL4-associated factor 6 [Sorghum bicolor]
MPPERTRMEELWEREVGSLPPKRFANSVMASKEYVQSLNIQKRLRKHRGCVNTISFSADGSLLLSGSDDRTLVLWDWQEAAPTLSFHTGHRNNVYHALFMPVSDDRSIVSCAADGEVIHSQIEEGGRVITDKLVELEFAVHRLAVEPASPHTFYCCCQDSSVWHFDLREGNAMELFKCRAAAYYPGENTALYAIALDPRKPCCFAVAGSDQYVRIYDTRKIFVDGNSSSSRPIEHFCPPHLIARVEEEITGLAYSQTSELLASYSHDDIYLFSREHGLHFNNIEVDKRLLKDVTELSFSFVDKLPIPKTFKGHENVETMKGVNFLGPNCDFVTSGSDCGSIFIWRKKDAELIRAMRGDKRIVNCVEQHPCGIVLASSGIDKDIKIWEPGEGENLTITQAHEDDEDIWISSDYDSDDFIISDGFGYVIDLDPAHLYENGDHESEEDEDTSSEEHDDGDNSAKEDDDGDNGAEEEDFDGGNSAGDEGDD